MQYMTWSDQMVSGISSVDDQHMKLLELLNGVYDAICGNQTRTDIVKVLDELIEYTVVHFRYEEGLLENGKYPLLAEHRAKHEALKAEVFEHRANLGSRMDLYLASEMLSFLKDWLQHHIMVHDKEACRYLLDHSAVGEAAA